MKPDQQWLLKMGSKSTFLKLITYPSSLTLLKNGPYPSSPSQNLTSSSTPGVAMKATSSGPIVGKALEAYSGEGEYHAHYGWALYLSYPSDPSMVEEAMEHVRRGIKLASHREKPYLFLGRLYKATGRVGMAECMFTRAVQIQPECVEGLRELRLISMRRKKSKGLIGRLLRR